MSSMSFHIYRNTHTNKWTLAYTINGHKHTAMFPTRSDALQASYRRAAAANE